MSVPLCRRRFWTCHRQTDGLASILDDPVRSIFLMTTEITKSQHVRLELALKPLLMARANLKTSTGGADPQPLFSGTKAVTQFHIALDDVSIGNAMAPPCLERFQFRCSDSRSA